MNNFIETKFFIYKGLQISVLTFFSHSYNFASPTASKEQHTENGLLAKWHIAL
jgi:hypothetical protein